MQVYIYNTNNLFLFYIIIFFSLIANPPITYTSTKSYEFHSGMHREYTINFNVEIKTVDMLFSFLKNENLKEILEILTYPSEYPLIQLKFEINTMKITENGTVAYSKIYVSKKFMRSATVEEILLKYRQAFDHCIDASETESSGWLIKGIETFKVCIAKNTHSIKKYGRTETKRFAYPPKCPGSHFIININTDSNCVELSMIAHFDFLENNKGLDERRKTLKHYKNLRGKYFNFPQTLDLVTLGDFDRIENQTNTNIILYSLDYGDNTNEIEFNLLRKGNNPNTHSNLEIHLCQLLDTNHIFLITNIQKYLQLVKYTHKGRVNVNKEICRFCLSKVNIREIKNHETLCREFKSTATIKELEHHENVSFSALNATEYNPFICYFDTETYITSSDKGLNEHHLLAYGYIILNRENEIISSEFKIKEESQTSDSLAFDMLQCIEKDYINIYDEYKKTWNREPILSESDQIHFDSSKSCDICNKNFSEKNKKNRHHRWDAKIEYDSHGRVIKSNYVGALCSSCNLRITIKYGTLPILAHNGARFDSKFILDGYNKDEFLKISLLSKQSENFMSIKIHSKSGLKLHFFDSFNFQSSSLNKIIKDLK